MESNLRKVFIISILVICVIAINLAVFFSITKKDKNINEEELLIDSAELTEKFNDIFDNELNYQNNNPTASKIDNTKELIYDSYINKEKVEGNYDLNVNIPCLNIKGVVAEEINNEINKLFYGKVENILTGTDKYTIYSVKYKAYINDNILSLVINSTLKEGNNPQRVIIKTYNYNLSSNEKLSINEVLEYRNLQNNYVQNEIFKTIKAASENANIYNDLGYSKYIRNINDNIYKIENTNVYFVGEDKALYILYPYGNTNYTSELDLLVI